MSHLDLDTQLRLLRLEAHFALEDSRTRRSSRRRGGRSRQGRRGRRGRGVSGVDVLQKQKEEEEEEEESRYRGRGGGGQRRSLSQLQSPGLARELDLLVRTTPSAAGHGSVLLSPQPKVEKKRNSLTVPDLSRLLPQLQVGSGRQEGEEEGEWEEEEEEQDARRRGSGGLLPVLHEAMEEEEEEEEEEELGERSVTDVDGEGGGELDDGSDGQNETHTNVYGVFALQQRDGEQERMGELTPRPPTTEPEREGRRPKHRGASAGLTGRGRRRRRVHPLDETDLLPVGGKSPSASGGTSTARSPLLSLSQPLGSLERSADALTPRQPAFSFGFAERLVSTAQSRPPPRLPTLFPPEPRAVSPRVSPRSPRRGLSTQDTFPPLPPMPPPPAATTRRSAWRNTWRKRLADVEEQRRAQIPAATRLELAEREGAAILYSRRQVLFRPLPPFPGNEDDLRRDDSSLDSSSGRVFATVREVARSLATDPTHSNAGNPNAGIMASTASRGLSHSDIIRSRLDPSTFRGPGSYDPYPEKRGRPGAKGVPRIQPPKHHSWDAERLQLDLLSDAQLGPGQYNPVHVAAPKPTTFSFASGVGHCGSTAGSGKAGSLRAQGDLLTAEERAKADLPGPGAYDPAPVIAEPAVDSMYAVNNAPFGSNTPRFDDDGTDFKAVDPFGYRDGDDGVVSQLLGLAEAGSPRKRRNLKALENKAARTRGSVVIVNETRAERYSEFVSARQRQHAVAARRRSKVRHNIVAAARRDDEETAAEKARRAEQHRAEVLERAKALHEAEMERKRDLVDNRVQRVAEQHRRIVAEHQQRGWIAVSFLVTARKSLAFASSVAQFQRRSNHARRVRAAMVIQDAVRKYLVRKHHRIFATVLSHAAPRIVMRCRIRRKKRAGKLIAWFFAQYWSQLPHQMAGAPPRVSGLARRVISAAKRIQRWWRSLCAVKRSAQLCLLLRKWHVTHANPRYAPTIHTLRNSLHGVTANRSLREQLAELRRIEMEKAKRLMPPGKKRVSSADGGSAPPATASDDLVNQSVIEASMAGEIDPKYMQVVLRRRSGMLDELQQTFSPVLEKLQDGVDLAIKLRLLSQALTNIRRMHYRRMKEFLAARHDFVEERLGSEEERMTVAQRAVSTGVEMTEAEHVHELMQRYERTHPAPVLPLLRGVSDEAMLSLILKGYREQSKYVRRGLSAADAAAALALELSPPAQGKRTLSAADEQKMKRKQASAIHEKLASWFNKPNEIDANRERIVRLLSSKAAQQLINSGHLDVNTPINNSGSTCLHTAAWFRLPLLTFWLISSGGNPNCANSKGNSPVHYACENLHKPRASMLLGVLIHAGGDVYQRRLDGKRPIDLAHVMKMVGASAVEFDSARFGVPSSTESTGWRLRWFDACNEGKLDWLRAFPTASRHCVREAVALALFLTTDVRRLKLLIKRHLGETVPSTIRDALKSMDAVKRLGRIKRLTRQHSSNFPNHKWYIDLIDLTNGGFLPSGWLLTILDLATDASIAPR